MEQGSNTGKHVVLVTGAAGYVGAMLVERLMARDDVARVIGLDKEPYPTHFDELEGVSKLVYICANTADTDNWREEVKSYNPDVIVHTAWQIRELYGDRATSWKWNIDGSDNVFDLAFTTPSVERLVHFSTVASYGAFPDNTTEHRYTEEEPFRKTDYLYAEEKRICEEHLEERYAAAKVRSTNVQVSIIRPAAITGPRGRFMRIRFGLQAALSGSLKGQKSFVYDLISKMVSWVPVTPTWLRQYIHEDDIAALVERLAFGAPTPGYEAFNAAPPGAAVYGPDMAKAVGKRMLPIQPWMARLAFFWFWHLTRGKVPTSRGSWKGYSYPIAVDGTKATKLLGFSYTHESFDAFYYTDGKYENFVPTEQRRHKTA
jgi:nucleoside-diphosphate-sugar epimerase